MLNIWTKTGVVRNRKLNWKRNYDEEGDKKFAKERLRKTTTESSSTLYIHCHNSLYSYSRMPNMAWEALKNSSLIGLCL